MLTWCIFLFYKQNLKYYWGPNMTTAENIKKFRKELCLTQTELAQLLKVTVCTISMYENGKRQPSYPTVRKMIELAKKKKIKMTFDDIRPE